jgi:hypothetical protein
LLEVIFVETTDSTGATLLNREFEGGELLEDEDELLEES